MWASGGTFGDGGDDDGPLRESHGCEYGRREGLLSDESLRWLFLENTNLAVSGPGKAKRSEEWWARLGRRAAGEHWQTRPGWYEECTR